ncbi:MAG: DUF1592 domain-containing protein [Myxococcales bacterium]|nr:DUF1592 domain-containing protein [Myxococcales bacterium]
MRPPRAIARGAGLAVALAWAAGCGGGSLGGDDGSPTTMDGPPGVMVPGVSGPGAPTGGQPPVAGNGEQPGGLPSSGADDPMAGGASGPSRSCARSLPAARAVPFNPRQYRQVLADLVGYEGADQGDLPPGLESDLDVLDRAWVTASVLDRVMREAEAAAESLRGRTADVLGCANLADTACLRTGLSGLMQRAYVRAPEPAELDALMELHAQALGVLPADGGESAALVAVQAILAAPSTLYRPEFLTPAQGDDMRVLSAHERAAGIAAFLLDSVPDDELLAAAQDGSLMTDAGLSAQVDRLLALPRVRRHLTGLVLNGYRATRVFESPKDEALFPEFTASMQASMFAESQRFVEDVLWTRGAPVSELLVGGQTFVDEALADLYGITLPPGMADAEGFLASDLPDGRAGLLTQASVLSGLSRTDKTSVVARGLFVRRDLLCLPKVPAPPEDIQAQVAEQLTAEATETELAMYRAQTQPCSGCHSQFDRFGLALEGFDPIGRTRLPAPEPIDLEGLRPLMGIVERPEDLVEVLVEDDRFTHCMAERLMDYALSTAAAGNAFCDTDALHAAVAAGDGTLGAVIHAIVSHPAFAARKEEQP